MMIVMVVLGLLWGLIIAAPVSAINLDFSSFVADYYLTEDDTGVSELKVREFLTIDFPTPKKADGVMRIIPRTNQDGRNKIVDGESSLDLKVTRNGQPENIRDIVEGQDDYTVYIGDLGETLQGVQTYYLEYSFSDVITEYDASGKNVSGMTEREDRQEFAWNIGLNDWRQSFNSVEVNLHLPENVRNNLKSTPSCQVVVFMVNPTNDSLVSSKKSAVPSGDGSQCTVSKLSDGFSFKASDFGTGETMQIVAEFVPNTFTVVLDKDYSAVVVLLLELIFGGGLVLFLYYRWRVKARHQYELYKHSPTPTQYLPPKDISVAEAAIVCRKTARAPYVATLLEMAVEGKILIRNLGSEWDIILHVEPETLSGPELESLHILANRRPLIKGAEIPVVRHTADRYLANHALEYQKSAYNLLVEKGFLKPQKIRRKLSSKIYTIIVVFVCMFVWGVISIYSVVGDRAFDRMQPSLNTIHVGGTGLELICLLLFVLIIFASIFLYRRTRTYQKYTDQGIHLAIYLDGLAKYLHLSEMERLSYLSSVKTADTSQNGLIHLSEELLPWACLFEVENSWADALAQYYEPLPADEDQRRRRDVRRRRSNFSDTVSFAHQAQRVNRSMEQSTYYTNRRDRR